MEKYQCRDDEGDFILLVKWPLKSADDITDEINGDFVKRETAVLKHLKRHLPQAKEDEKK